MPDPHDRRAGLVLDTDAVAAFAQGSLRVGEEIAAVAARDGDIVLPALCLAEAYQRAEGGGHDYLDLLVSHAHVTVAPVAPDDCWVIGGWAKRIGSLPLAQAAVETAARPLIPLLTAHRDRVTAHLAKEWPIIDL